MIRSRGANRLPLLLRPNVVRVESVAVTEVEASAADDRMRPSRPLAAFGELELADKPITVRRRPDQGDLASLAHGVEHSTGTGERAFAYPLLGVHLPPGFPVETEPFGVIVEVGRAVDAAVHQDHAAMAIVEFLGSPRRSEIWTTS